MGVRHVMDPRKSFIKGVFGGVPMDFSAGLQSPEIRVRFGAVLEICSRAEECDFFARFDQVYRPLLSFFLREPEPDIIEAGLSAVARVLRHHPQDFLPLLEATRTNPYDSQLALALLGRIKELERNAGSPGTYDLISLDHYGPRLAEVISTFSFSEHSSVRLSAQALMIQLGLSPRGAHALQPTLPDFTFAECEDILDPLMRRRVVALAPFGLRIMPCLETLEDSDDLISCRAVGRLLDAGSIADGALLEALQSDEPLSVVAVLNGLRVHSDQATRLIRRTPTVASRIERCLVSSLRYTRTAAFLCIMDLGDTLLDVRPALASKMVAQGGMGEDWTEPLLIRFIARHVEKFKRSDVDLIPLLVKVLRERDDVVSMNACRVISSHASFFLQQGSPLLGKLPEHLRVHAQWRPALSRRAEEALVAMNNRFLRNWRDAG